MGYDWDDKRDVCYRLYVEERKSLEDVVEYFKDKLEFVPSKRTFQTQFRRWGFPTKLDYSHKDEAVVQRVRDMWEQNVMQKDMLPVLHAEGFHVTESGLTRLRAKHGMALKSANAVKTAVDNDHDEATGPTMSEPQTGGKRKDLHQDIPAISKPRERVKKRRRQTTGDASGVQDDPSAPPRYPSETTIGDAQKFLGLDDDMYREVRDQFRLICEERDIIKKTICGPERWDAAKDYLVQEYPYLHQLFLTDDIAMVQPLRLSLDIICMDVTKYIRVQSKTMSLAEAKNTLGLNPLESRVLKQKLIDILKANNFVNTYESDNWSGLKEQWLQGTPIKARMPAEDSPDRERFMKALQLLCRDTLKRWREAQRLAKLKASEENGEYPAPTPSARVSSTITKASPQRQSDTPKPARRGRKSNGLAQQTRVEARIDPSLLQAAHTSGAQVELHGVGTYPLPDATDAAMEPPLPVYFRRSPHNGDIGVPPLWLGVLATRSLAGLHRAALNFAGGPNYGIMKIEGVTPSPGGELLYQIDENDELQGYLLHNEGNKATFVVHLAPRM